MTNENKQPDERALIDAFAPYRDFPVGWIADYARDVIQLARATAPQATVKGEERAEDACRINPVSSRVCERGTKSCDCYHGLAAAPQAGAALTDDDIMDLWSKHGAMCINPDAPDDIIEFSRALLATQAEK